MGVIDNLLSEPPGSTRPVVACDMEGTLSGGVTWKGMRDYLVAHGRGATYRRLMRKRLVQISLFRLGLINQQKFKESWMIDMLSLFAGMSHDEFAHASDWIVENELWAKRRRPVIEELKNHRDQGRRVVVISGLIEPMLARFVAKIGVEAIGTPILFLDEVFSGRTAAPFTTGGRKVEQLEPFLNPAGRIAAAYGDTAADIPMLSLSENPTAVFPEKNLRHHALTAGWRILA